MRHSAGQRFRFGSRPLLLVLSLPVSLLRSPLSPSGIRLLPERHVSSHGRLRPSPFSSLLGGFAPLLHPEAGYLQAENLLQREAFPPEIPPPRGAALFSRLIARSRTRTTARSRSRTTRRRSAAASESPFSERKSTHRGNPALLPTPPPTPPPQPRGTARARGEAGPPRTHPPPRRIRWARTEIPRGTREPFRIRWVRWVRWVKWVKWVKWGQWGQWGP